MNRSTEQLVRWASVSWLWVFAVLAGLAAGELVKKWPEPTGWDGPSQLADGSDLRTCDVWLIRGSDPQSHGARNDLQVI